MSYTVTAALGVLVSLVLDIAVLRTRLVTRRAFWVSYAIIVVAQLAVNGVLTGRDVVRYDPETILGLRIVYAPVEDLAFGFALVLQTLCWWTYWGRRGIDRSSSDRTAIARAAPGTATRSRRGVDTRTRRSSTR